MFTEAMRRFRCRSLWFLVSLVLLFGAVCGANASDSAEDFWGFGPVVAQFTVVDCPWDLDLQQPCRVVLQVIDNVFHKWHEYDIGDTVEFCIVLYAPEQRKLTAPEAQALLEASSQWVTQVPDPSEGYTLDPGDPRLDLPPAMPPHPEAMGPPAVVDDKPDVEAPRSSTVPLKIGREDHVSGTSRDLLPLNVIGDDERVRISQSTVERYPWNTIGFIGNEFPNGTRWRGTGFLVTPYMILTNGHIVYNAGRGGFVTELEFAPGQYQASEGAIVERPYGSRQTVDWRTNQQYVNTGRTEYDYAVAFINTPFADITTFMPLEFDYTPAYINTSGYPGTAQGETTRSMWWSHSDAWISPTVSRVLRYVADTSGGQSGSPVWVYFSTTGLRRVVAVHAVGGTTSNGGPRLVGQNQSLIEYWMGWTPQCSACTPGGPNPSSGATNVSVNHDLSWSCSGGNGWTSFDIYFGTSSSPPLVKSNHTSTSYTPGTLQCETRYYWKIVAKKTDCDPATGPIWDFTTEACERCQACTPANPNPSDGALNAPLNPTLSWSCSGGDGWTNFDIYFGTSSSPPLVKSDHTSTSYTPGTLQCETRYYWKIVAKKTDCDPATGPIWDFRTYTGSQRQCISLVTSWNFISLGLEPDNPSPQAVFDEVTGTLYLWNWDADTEAWKTVINGLLTQVRALGGYWIWLPQGLTVCVEGTPLTGDHTLTLGPAGWQQIGVPYDVAWGTGNGGSIMVEHAGEVKSLAEAVAAGWIFNTIWEWDSSSEAWIKPTVLTGATLDQWTGYWIYTFVDSLVLHFSPVGPGEPPPPTTMSVKTTVPAAPPKPQEPSLQLLALRVINDPNPIHDVHTTTFRVLGVCPCNIQELRIKVYNLAGRLVWEGEGDTAYLTWHTQNMLGEYLSNGVYLYQAQVKISGEWVTTPLEKLAILR